MQLLEYAVYLVECHGTYLKLENGQKIYIVIAEMTFILVYSLIGCNHF